MNVLLVAAVVLGLGLGIAVGLANRRKGGKGKARRYPPTPQDPERFRPGHPDFDPKTGAWKTWDGTPHGAIDTLLTDAEGDAGSGDFDGDGWAG